jgi:hypothetical protein
MTRLRDHTERFISNGIPLSDGLGTVKQDVPSFHHIA